MSAELGALEILVGLAVVAAAVVTLWAPRLSAMVAFLSFGVVLTTMWAVMGAPDIALAEAALGTGVTGALFIEAVTRDAERPRTRNYPAWLAAVAAGALGAALIPLVAILADRASGGLATDLVDATLSETGVEHPVTAVLLAYRAYDTFLEIAVLLVAAVVARSLSGTARPLTDGHQLLRAFVVRLLPLLVIVAGWVLFAGSSLPGGAFQSGAILAGALVLARVSGIGQFPEWATRATVGLGMASFLAFAVLGVGDGTWLAPPSAAATVLIVILESLLTVSIAVCLALMVTAVGQAEPDLAEVAP